MFNILLMERIQKKGFVSLVNFFKILRMRLSFVLFVVLNSTLIACAQNNVPASLQERISAVENNLGTWVKIDDKGWNLQERMAFHKIHGVTVAVIKDYKIDWAKGYGFADTSDKRPVTTQTLFQAASISKSLNAVGLLLLADQKKKLTFIKTSMRT